MQETSQDQFIQEYVSHLKEFIQSIISSAKTQEKQLELLIEHPNCLKIYSSEKVLEINQKKRDIPSIVQSLVLLGDRVCLENYEFVISGQAKHELLQIRDELNEIQKIIELRGSEIPEFKPSITFRLLFPVQWIPYQVKKLKRKIVLKKLAKEKAQPEKGNGNK